VMDRRLQTQVFSKGFARSTKQARQFITHGHVMIGEKKITIPSYLVKQDEENLIRFDERSSLTSPDHPERTIVKKEKPEVKKETANKKEETAKPERKERKVRAIKPKRKKV